MSKLKKDEIKETGLELKEKFYKFKCEGLLNTDIYPDNIGILINYDMLTDEDKEAIIGSMEFSIEKHAISEDGSGEPCWKLVDNQGGNLGDIETEEFPVGNYDVLMDRFDGYYHDYGYYFVEELKNLKVQFTIMDSFDFFDSDESEKCSEPIIVNIDLGDDGMLLIKAWDISQEDLEKKLHRYNKMYQNEEVDCAVQDYLNSEQIKYEEYKPYGVDLDIDEEEDGDDVKCEAKQELEGNEEPIVISIYLGEDGNLLIKAWNISQEQLENQLHRYNKMYQNEEVTCSVQDYLLYEKIKYEEYSPYVVNLNMDEK